MLARAEKRLACELPQPGDHFGEIRERFVNEPDHAEIGGIGGEIGIVDRGQQKRRQAVDAFPQASHGLEPVDAGRKSGDAKL